MKKGTLEDSRWRKRRGSPLGRSERGDFGARFLVCAERQVHRFEERALGLDGDRMMGAAHLPPFRLDAGGERQRVECLVARRFRSAGLRLPIGRDAIDGPPAPSVLGRRQAERFRMAAESQGEPCSRVLENQRQTSGRHGAPIRFLLWFAAGVEPRGVAAVQEPVREEAEMVSR